MKNKNQPVYPINDNTLLDSKGLTKREHFASMAMQGLLSKFGDLTHNPKDIANYAVDYADELLKELEK